jgi:hypothetical protein
MVPWTTNLTISFLSLFWAIGPSFGQKSSLSQNKAPKVPLIQNIGVIPLQVVGGTDNQNGYIDRLAGLLPETVRETKRFKVINDDLVSSLWESKEGRQELVKDFEISGLIAVSVQEKSDLVTLTAQLLNPTMQPYLFETETINKHEIAFLSEQETRNLLQNLVFRMSNRIPFDVSVTSIQGPFVTLSGGAEQNLEINDQLQVIRAQILSTHPANKTWLEFKRSPLGTAQVIEVKNHTSIAKITSQTYDGAIEVGDGAKVANIANRRKFAYAQTSQTLKDAGSQSPLMVTPILVDSSKPEEQKVAKQEIAPAAKPNQPNPTPSPPKETSMPATSEKLETEPQTPSVNEDQEEKSVWEDVSSEATSHKLLEALTVYFGPYWWSVRGPANSSGRFPIYLVNHLGAGINRTMLYKFKLTMGGGGVFGDTPAGGYLGYDAFARFFWEDHFAGDFLSWWRAGGASSFSGINVSKGLYGGGDWIRGGFFGGVGGFFNVGEPSSRIDWFGDFTITPLNIGRVGYEGAFKQVESAMGWRLELGGFLWSPPEDIQYGGMFQLSDERLTLKNGRRPHFKDFAIKALIKFAL